MAIVRVRVSASTMFGAAVVTLAFLAVAPTRAASVKEIFEKYQLLGMFAVDCTKPPSDDNRYFVHRLVDPDHLQRDRVSGPGARDYAYMIDQASEVGPQEVSVSGTRVEGSRKGEPSTEIWRIERDRLKIMEGTLGNVNVISSGRYNRRAIVPWINRCRTQ